MAGLLDLTYTDLIKKVESSLGISAHKLRIMELISKDQDDLLITQDSFRTLQAFAARSEERVLLLLKTASELPESNIPEIEGEDPPRLSPYDAMVAERTSEIFDLNDRFWVWVALQKAARVEKSLIRSDVQVLEEALNSAEDCLQVCFLLAICAVSSNFCSGSLCLKTPTNMIWMMNRDYMRSPRRKSQNTANKKGG